MLMFFLTVALVHIIVLMSQSGLFLCSQTAISRSRREAMMRAGDHLRRHGLGGSGTVKPEPDPRPYGVAA